MSLPWNNVLVNGALDADPYKKDAMKSYNKGWSVFNRWRVQRVRRVRRQIQCMNVGIQRLSRRADTESNIER